jgi:aspartyl-tRNA(Asn)/glutamyl-tRNA(Gln) amidotransferase subunit C
MEITPKMNDHLANLSRLKFDLEKKENIRNDVERMVVFIEKLQALNTDGIEPLLFMSDTQNLWRADEVKGSISRKDALSNSPVKDEQFFKVPKVIKK